MAATLVPPFGVQQPEDSMEISSEYGNMDADIDIDLDGPTDTMHFAQDDQPMLEDPKSDRPDDLMLDDASHTEDNDRVMQDDAPAQEQDEELLDFSEDEDEDIQIETVTEPHFENQPVLQPEHQVDQQPTIVEEPVEDVVQSELATDLLTEGVQPLDKDVSHVHESEVQPQVEPASVPSPSHPSTATPSNNGSQPPTAEQSHDVPEPTTDLAATEHPVTIETASESVAPTIEVAQADSHEHTQPTHKEAHDIQQNEQGNDTDVAVPTSTKDAPTLAPLETEVSVDPEHDEDASRERQVNSPTVTGLHPTIVEYAGNEIYLFPSRDPVVSEQYLLENENLVTTSLGDLLQACRTALGDGLTEDDELVLGVEELDLFVSEDSTPAFSTSFSELLDLYLQLHKLDGNDDPSPFRVTLTTKTRFTNRLSMITQAISEGKGFSKLPFLEYYEYDEPTEFPDESFGDDLDEEHDTQAENQLEDKDYVEDVQHVGEADESIVPALSDGQKVQQSEQNKSSHAAEAQQSEYQGGGEAEHTAVEATTLHGDEEEPSATAVNQHAPEKVDGHEQNDQQGEESALNEEEINFEDEVENKDHEQPSVSVEQDGQANEADQHFDEHVEQEDYHEEGEAEDHEFGQGEFFDEENYETFDNNVYHEDAEQGDVPEATTVDSHEQTDQADAAYDDDQDADSGHIARAESPAQPRDHADVTTVNEHVETEKQNVEHEADQIHGDAEPKEDESFLNGIDEIDGEESTSSKAIGSKADDADNAGDFDEINFDDEDDFDEEGIDTTAEVAAAPPAKASPSAKRSISELDDAEVNDQDSKKARAT